MSASSVFKATFFILLCLAIIATASFVVLLNRERFSTIIVHREKSAIAKRDEGQEFHRKPNVINLTRSSQTIASKELKIVVLYWSRAFSLTPPVNFNPQWWPFFYAGNNCPIKCELTTDKTRVRDASALVVHARNTQEMPPRRFKNLTWILHTNENPVYTSSLQDPEIMSQFNYFASYRLDSDFPCPEFTKPNLETPVPFQEKWGLIMVAISNCETVRTMYVRSLMRFIEVDSYGACLRNKEGLIHPGGTNSRRAVRELQRNYKFSLVFPNADCDYYMTEKIQNTLSAGSVPVWMGTDKIDEVLPWGNLRHSVIKVSDFSSPKKLAKYLLRLARKETEYNKYLRWKYEGFQFPVEYYKSPIGQWWDGLPLYCRVCMKIAQDPRGHRGLPVDKCDGNQRRTVRKWLSLRDS